MGVKGTTTNGNNNLEIEVGSSTERGGFPGGDRVSAVDPENHSVMDPFNLKAAGWLCAVLMIFIVLLVFMPLRTAIQIGADEGYELAKATLSIRGVKSYSEMWNDQPMFHTFVITQILKHFSASALGPRLLTSLFAIMLLTGVFLIGLRISGLCTATLAAIWLLASPGFLELGSSCMVEIPALAPIIASLAVLLWSKAHRFPKAEILAGAFFSVSLAIKFIGIIYLPLILALILLHHCGRPNAVKKIIVSCGAFASTLLIGIIVLNLMTGETAYWLQLEQAWGAHFAGERSLEFGSAADHPFDWFIFLKHWDATIPAMLGLAVVCKYGLQQARFGLPLCWLALTLVVFGQHTPWWSYYYVHNAVPIALFAGIGLAWVGERVRHASPLGYRLAIGVFCLAALSWMGSRLYLEVRSANESPRTFNALVLDQMNRFKSSCDYLYSDQPVYSFHTRIPMPPKLAVVSLKRFLSGNLTGAGLAAELERVKPGMFLLRNDTGPRPFDDLVQSEYRLVYEDPDCRLYVLRSIVTPPRFLFEK